MHSAGSGFRYSRLVSGGLGLSLGRLGEGGGERVGQAGDFQYFVIVDRLGVDIEIVSNMFGPGLRPTGQRGIYAIWRNTSKILDPAAFRVLVAG